MKDAVISAAKDIQREEVKQAPHDTGNLQRSIQFRYQPIQAIIEPVANYATYVHEGTKPHHPPVRAIQGWALKRGINPFALAKSMARKGTPPNKFVERTVENVGPKVSKYFETALEKIVNVLAE